MKHYDDNDIEFEPVNFEVDLGEEMPFEELCTFDWRNDPNCLLGQSWISRGKSILLIGQTGVGKSVLAQQLAIGWSLGKAPLGITSIHPLKILLVQQENDMRDMAKATQGIVDGLKLTQDEIGLCGENFKIYRNVKAHGDDFIRLVRTIAESSYKPDILIADPISVYLGNDVKDNESWRFFLYQQLSPIMQETGLAVIFVHHTGKPLGKANGPVTESDLAYLGIGGSFQANWAREVLVLRRLPGDYERPTFNLTAVKRRLEAGFRSKPMDTPTNVITVEHSEFGDFWEQRQDAFPPKDKDQMPRPRGRPRKTEDAKADEMRQFTSEVIRLGGTLNGHNEVVIAQELRCSVSKVRLLWKEWKDQTNYHRTNNTNNH